MSAEPRRPKRVKQFDKIEERKTRIRTLSSDAIKGRLARGYLTKEGAIALRQVLEERRELKK